MTDAGSGIRERRLARGLTQAELATRAGVSRQLVAAVEASRHSPAVDAALGIARALGTTVEDLFAPNPIEPASALGGLLREGALLRVGQVDTRLVAEELPDHGITGAVWAKPDAVVEHGKLRMLPGAIPAGFVLAGCDPALGVAEALLAGMGPLSLLAVSAPTGRALRAMAAGGVHAAVVHGPPDNLPEPPADVVRWHLARWQVGLAVDRDLHATSVAKVLRSRAPLVQQDPAAVSQQAFERAAQATGRKSLPEGPRATSHLDAARKAHDRGGAGVTIESCARAFDLDFLPLEEHVVELWVDQRWVAHPAFAALGEVLTTPAFTGRVQLFGGYDLTHCGDRIEAA
ncbi:MAG TPA: substrate-binding domain-containing protein [Acidimicrobiales bacterium]|jgi:transcriptional regulator with XRE-family HTH domain|nr:substrate-binding domain-containing protein [Acidimicrobiales bacterium]